MDCIEDIMYGEHPASFLDVYLPEGEFEGVFLYFRGGTLLCRLGGKISAPKYFLSFSKYLLTNAARCGIMVSVNKTCGFSSFGRARPCQGRGGGFEPRNPLQRKLSSAGRASALQAEGHRFEPCSFHHIKVHRVCAFFVSPHLDKGMRS